MVRYSVLRSQASLDDRGLQVQHLQQVLIPEEHVSAVSRVLANLVSLYLVLQLVRFGKDV